MARSKTSLKKRLTNRRMIVALAFDIFFVGVIATVFGLNPKSHASNYSITGWIMCQLLLKPKPLYWYNDTGT